MENNDNLDHLLDDYLLRRMDEGQRATLEKAMATDALLREKVEVRSAILEALRRADEDRMRNLMQQWELEADAAKPDVTSSKMPRRLPWLLAGVAAVAAVLLVVLFLPSRNERLFRRYYHPDPGLAVYQGGPGDSLSAGMLAYKEEDYRLAVSIFQNLEDAHGKSDTLSYFMGCSWLQLGKDGEAITQFERVMQQPPGAFSSDAQWYGALANLNQGNLPRCKELLTAIETMADHPRHDVALALMRELETE